MALVEKTVLLPYSAEQMFALVDNVADYPQFMPWCSEAKVLDAGDNIVHASVGINYLGVKQSFTTENTRQAPSRIDMRLKDGPFRQLEGDWQFMSLSPSACKIAFRLHYEFSSKLLEKLVGAVFHHIANSFVDAFVRRAEQIYG